MKIKSKYLYIIVSVVIIIILTLSSRIVKEKFTLENYNLYENNFWGQKKLLMENILDFKYAKLKGIGDAFLVIETESKNQVYEGLEVGNWIKFYKYKDGEVYLKYESDFTKVRPWMIDVGHIDDDGRDDVFIGAYKKTKFYPLDKRPFFFNWDGEKLTKKWTGSYINVHELMDMEFVDEDQDGIDEVKTIEQLQDGSKIVNYYKWSYFNFVIKQ